MTEFKKNHIYFKNDKLINTLSQILIPSLTLSAQYAIASGSPKWGLIINLAAQPFWIYSAYKGYKQAGQIGILITAILFTTITAWGIFNYWSGNI